MDQCQIIEVKDNNNRLNIEIDRKLFGLQNIGHSCYMNSFLQILLHTPHFLETLKESYNGITNEPLIDSLIEISEYPNIKSLKQIKKIMAEEDESFGKQVQNDSQEFGVSLLNKIITRIKGKPSFEEDDYYEEENLQIDKNYKIKKYENYINKYCKEETKLDEMFQFHEIMFNVDSSDQKIGSYKSIDFNSFLNVELTFPIKDNKNTYSLFELLRYKYPKNPLTKIKEDDIDSRLILKLWKMFIEFIKSFFYITENSDINEDIELFYNNMASLPNILIISINRAFLGKSIIKKGLTFEDTLDLKECLENDFQDREKNTKYKLYGVNICHKSLLLNVGHYYSYVRIKGIWYKFDDNKPVEKESPDYNSKYVVGLYYIKENLI